MQKKGTNLVATKKKLKPLVSRSPIPEPKSADKRAGSSAKIVHASQSGLSENDKKYGQKKWEQMRNLLHTVKAVRSGNFSLRLAKALNGNAYIKESRLND